MRIRTTDLSTCSRCIVIRTMELVSFVALIRAFAEASHEIRTDVCAVVQLLVQVRTVVAHTNAGQIEFARRHFGQRHSMGQQAASQRAVALQKPRRTDSRSMMANETDGLHNNVCGRALTLDRSPLASDRGRVRIGRVPEPDTCPDADRSGTACCFWFGCRRSAAAECSSVGPRSDDRVSDDRRCARMCPVRLACTSNGRC